MIASTIVAGRDLYAFVAGVLVLVLYAALRASGRDLLRRGLPPRATWSPWEALLLIFGMVVFQGVFAGIAKQLGVESRSWRLVVSWIAPLGVCLYVYLGYLHSRPETSERPGNWSGLRSMGRGGGIGVLFWLASIPVVLSVFVAWSHVYRALGGVPEEQEILRVLQADPVPFFLTAVIFAPLVEEVLFRGLLYPSLKVFGGTGVAVLLSGGLFALAHYDLTVGPALFAMGVMLALSYEMTGTLWTPIGFHAAFNLWTFLGKMA